MPVPNYNSDQSLYQGACGYVFSVVSATDKVMFADGKSYVSWEIDGTTYTPNKYVNYLIKTQSSIACSKPGAMNFPTSQPLLYSPTGKHSPAFLLNMLHA